MGEPVVLPPATIGVVGGGQLGRFFVRAAHELGYEVWVLEPDPESPAGRVADRHLVSDYSDEAALETFGRSCAAVTTEFENVPAGVLEALAGLTVVRPSAAAVSVCQDRIAEKSFLRAAGVPVGPFAPVRSAEDLGAADPALFPGILKTARLGYDGKGQFVVDDPRAAAQAYEGTGGRDCVLEQALDLERELSVVLSRTAAGEVATFAPVTNVHVGGILDTSTLDLGATQDLGAEAQALAVTIAHELGYVGTLAVELFVVGGRLLVNEIAPRPHNSGHLTLDACRTDQFEQQVRALCGLPLGDPAAHSSAVMVNLLGDLWLPDRLPAWDALLGTPGLRLHLYGKRSARAGRKMGHFTVLGDDVDELAASARAAKDLLASCSA